MEKEYWEYWKYWMSWPTPEEFLNEIYDPCEKCGFHICMCKE